MPFRVRQGADSSSTRAQKIAFDNFEVDLRSGEVRKNGTRIRLQAQPFQLLVLLLENAGEVVTRQEICRELWPGDMFVAFEHSLPAAVNKIREALGDAADDPRFIETLPKRGYRFIGKIKPEAPVVMAVAEPQQTVGLVKVPAAKGRSRRNWALGLAGVAVAAAVVLMLLARKPAHSEVNAQPVTAVPFTSYPGLETTPSLSPDGSRIAFAWDPRTGNPSGKWQYDLYVKAIGSETLLRLTNHPSDWISSTWSPDGTQIAFHRLADDDKGIYAVPALGGPERKLIATHSPYAETAPMSWSPDGKWLAYADTENGRPGDRAFLLNMETLESHEFPHDPACRHEAFLTFSHRGQQLLLVCVHNTTSFEYLVTDLQGRSKRPLTTLREFPSSAVWSGDDTSVIAAVDTAKGNEFIEIRVRDGQEHKLSGAAGDWPTISHDGHKLAFSVSDDRIAIWRKDLQDPQAPAVQMYSSTRMQNNSQYSPDGRHVAFDSARSGTRSIWIADSDGSNPVQITQDEPASVPRWSPDSQKIAFTVEKDGSPLAVYTADIADRVVHKLKTNVQDARLPFWSHDGKWIYFLAYEGTGHQLYRCPAEGGNATLLVADIKSTTTIQSVDGKLLYFPSEFSDANMMSLELDRAGATPQQVPGMPKISNSAQWALLSDGIYFSPQDRPRSICFYDFATRQTRKIFKVDKDLNGNLSISPDRRYMLYSQIDESNADIMLVNDFR